MYEFLKGRLIFTRFLMLTAALLLIAVGICTLYAIGNPAQSSPTGQNEEMSQFWQKQLMFAAIGLVGFVIVNFINYRILGRLSYWIYCFIIMLLIVVLMGKYVNLPFVPMINGTYRWIRIGPLPALQPSELFKLAYILAFAWYLRFRGNYDNFTSLIGPFALTMLPVGLILLEPDLGTVMLTMPVLFVMLFMAGAKVKHLLVIILLAVIISPVLWGQIKPYQRLRISSVLLQSKWLRDKAAANPKFSNILIGRDQFSERQWTRDAGFHLIRSKYAIASGGLTGYGYRKGPFVKYNFFLPERHTDFIFAVIAHQWGFLGSIALLGIYAILIGCGVKIAANNTDPFARLVAIGIVTTFSIEVLINISMTLGLMPITGLTLPFVSYGGSSLLTHIVAVGLLNNIGRSRPFSVAPKSFE